MSPAILPTGDLYLVVGYDGFSPASRALDASVILGETGRPMLQQGDVRR
jgi:hypothetical protein